MPAPATGLARITIRAPRRRVDLAVPHQIPLAELLPEVVVRAGEVADPQLGAPTGGWMLRRADGAPLVGDRALSPQGVRDGDVLYLVPRRLTWPEPDYDDVVEEIAGNARDGARRWDAAVSRTVALAAVTVILVSGLGAMMTRPDHLVPGLLAAVLGALLVGTAAVLSRGLGDGVVAVVTGGCALGYAAGAGWLLVGVFPGQSSGARILVAGSALLVTSVVAAAAVGSGLPLFIGGAVAGLTAAAAGFLGLFVGLTGAAAVAVTALIATIGLAPWLAVRLGRLPLPAVSADPRVIAAERRPDQVELRAVVARADKIMVGWLGGVAVGSLLAVTVLAMADDVSSGLLATLGSTAMLLRSRVFPTVPARLPLLVGGALGLAFTAWARLPGAGTPAIVIVFGTCSIAVAVLLVVAAGVGRRSGVPSPYVARFAESADIAVIVALAPFACAVLGLFGFARNLAS